MNRWIVLTSKASMHRALGIAAAVALSGGALAQPDSALAKAEPKTQEAELQQLTASFHRAASVHDPVNGDSQAVVDRRIKQMLSLWTEDGILRLRVGPPEFQGDYVGRGDVLSNCPAPSRNPANQGTLCTFFKHRAGSFQLTNKFVSLAPAYKTQLDIHGRSASVYFECHYFNVGAVNPLTGMGWTEVSHIVFRGSARKDHGRWLFSFADAPPALVEPIP